MVQLSYISKEVKRRIHACVRRDSSLHRRRVFWTLIVCLGLGMVLIPLMQRQGSAEDEAQYVGSQVCSKCHSKQTKEWAMTVHRSTVYNKEPSRNGCESCHGPGSEHVSNAGDPEKIIRLEKLSPDKVSTICMKCHTQADVTLWRTSTHARSKVSCTDCHDPHAADVKSLTKDIDNAKIELEGLSRAIKDAELAAQITADGSDEQTKAVDKVKELKDERDKLTKELKGQETIYQRSAEPYLCYNCHKAQQSQMRLPSHHPVPEGKMTCSACHNPHGGPAGMLREESINQTCYRCHAEKEGPFVFDHPPVSEDCSICHQPHGSVNNNLLVQGEPFVCLKCHAGPHSRSKSLGSAKTFATYYTECTDCHNQVHGSDEHSAFHF